MAGAERLSPVGGIFPANLPVKFDEQSACGVPLQALLGRSICGAGAYISLYDKVFPPLQAALLSCIGEGIGKSTVELVATIIVTIIALPILCFLSLLYHSIAGGLQLGYGLSHYFAHKGDEAAQYIDLFKGATQHFCFAGLDMFGFVSTLTFLFAGAFAFDKAAVVERFTGMEEAILNGSAFNSIVNWGHRYGWIDASTATKLGVPRG